MHVLKAECQCCCVDCRFTHVPVSLSHYHSTTGSSHINDFLGCSPEFPLLRAFEMPKPPYLFQPWPPEIPLPTHSAPSNRRDPVKSQQASSLRHNLTWLPFHCCPRRIHFFLNFFFSKIYKDFKYCYDYLLFDFEYFIRFNCACS